MVTCNHKNRKHQITEWIVYENDNEFRQTLIPLKTLEKATVDDYIRTDDGFYCPIIRDVVIGRTKATHCREITFPLNNIIKLTVYNDTGIIKQKFISWKREGRPARTNLTPMNRLIVKYMKTGMNLYQAYHLAYPNVRQVNSMKHLVNIVENPKFISYLIEEGIMTNTKSKFESIGWNENALLQELKNSIEDGRMAPASKANLILKLLDMIDEDENKNNVTVTRTLTMTNGNGSNQLSPIEIVRQQLKAKEESDKAKNMLAEATIS